MIRSKSFEKYKYDFLQEDLELGNDKNTFCKNIFKYNNQMIIISLNYPLYENHLCILLDDGSDVNKYIFDLTDVHFSEYLLDLLLSYNFGRSQLSQLEQYNLIQERITDHYKEQKEYQSFYQQVHKNSLMYSITLFESYELKLIPIRCHLIEVII